MIDNSQYAEKGNVGRAGSVIWPKNPDPRINGPRPRIFFRQRRQGGSRGFRGIIRRRVYALFSAMMRDNDGLPEKG